MRKVWRSIWFMDDDDNTSQGKLARGTFYIFYFLIFMVLVNGAIMPTIDHFCGGCLR